MSDWPPSGTPAYTKTETHVETEEITHYIEDIVDVQFPRGTWETSSKIVFDGSERIKKMESDFERGFYSKFRELIQSCVSLGNQLIVICKLVVEKHHTGKKWSMGRHYSHPFFGSLPKSIPHDLSDFTKMTKWSEKKGLIQLQYYYLMKLFQAKYDKLIVYPSADLTKRREAIVDQLKKLGYVGETDPELQRELTEIETQITGITIKRKEVEKTRDSERDALLLKEKTQIQDTVNLIRKDAGIRDYYVFDFTSGNSNTLKEYHEKYNVILKKNASEYRVELNAFLKPITNWEAIHNTPQLQQQIQQAIDKIKEKYVTRYDELVQQFTQEMEAFYNANFYTHFEETKKQIESRYEKLQDLQTNLLRRQTDLLPEVEALMNQFEKK